jgi:prepilin-type N-terminal cleavage/methylation domain-containing protein
MKIKKKINNNSSPGFTLIELVATLAIFSFLVYLSSISYIKIQKSRLLADNSWRVEAVLREAQAKSAAGIVEGEDLLSFGVAFSNNNYQEFATTTDFSNRQTGYDLVTDLPSNLQFINLNLPNNCFTANDCIIFSPIEGNPSNSGQLTIEDLNDGNKKTITINQLGKVNF